MNLVSRENRDKELLKYSIPKNFLENIGEIESLKFQVEKPESLYSQLPYISNYKIIKDKTIIPIFERGESFYVLTIDELISRIIYFELENDEVYRDYGMNWELLLLDIMIDYFDFAVDDELMIDEFVEIGNMLGFSKSKELFELRNLSIEDYNKKFENDKNWRKEIAQELNVL